MPKLLFASYAHENRDQYLVRFIDELSEEIRQLRAGVLPDDVVFLDRTGIKTGDDWLLQLSDAVRHCKACIAICSPAFIASEFCGKELRVFLNRLESWLKNDQNRRTSKRPIFPIMWIAKPKPPEVISRFQRDEGALPSPYAVEGLRTMYRLKKYSERRKELVTLLATRINDALDAVDLPDGDPIPHFDFISSAFLESNIQTRYGVALVPLLKDGIRATPYSTGETLGSIVQAAFGNVISWREVQQDAQLPGQLQQAELGREVTLVISDLETLSDALYQSTVDAVASNLGKNSALLIVRRDGSSAAVNSQAEISVRGAFKSAIERGTVVDTNSIRSAAELRRAIEQTIARLRKSVIEADAPRKAEHAVLEANAAASGIPIGQLTALLPTVSP